MTIPTKYQYLSAQELARMLEFPTGAIDQELAKEAANRILHNSLPPAVPQAIESVSEAVDALKAAACTAEDARIYCRSATNDAEEAERKLTDALKLLQEKLKRSLRWSGGEGLGS